MSEERTRDLALVKLQISDIKNHILNRRFKVLSREIKLLFHIIRIMAKN